MWRGGVSMACVFPAVDLIVELNCWRLTTDRSHTQDLSAFKSQLIAVPLFFV